jgi:arylsulfatase
MTMTRALLPALLPVLLLSACDRQVEPRTADEVRNHAQGMNVALIVLDAANASHFSFMGYERETTPNIDRLADEGVVFEQAYAQASATPLSMYSMLSSRYPILEQADYPESAELAAVLHPAMPTLPSWGAERFADRGAFVANRWLREELGFHHGWTTFDMVYEHVAPTEVVVRATLVTDAFLDWVDRDGPWLAWLHYLEPHLPYTPPEPYLSMFDPEFRFSTDGRGTKLQKEWRHRRPSEAMLRNTVGLYDGNLAWVDSEVGRVFEGLKEDGEWDRTIVVVTSDHGEAFWEHRVRGHGDHVFEEFVQVPLVIRVPGLAPRRIAEAVELVDVVPTLLDLAGVFVPEGGVAGGSLVEVMTGERDAANMAFFRNHEKTSFEVGARRGPLKYIEFSGVDRVALYDLGKDPGEQNNLVPFREEAAPEIETLRQSMKGLLDRWVEAGSGTGDDFSPSLSGADSLDADTVEALRAIGYFGN